MADAVGSMLGARNARVQRGQALQQAWQNMVAFREEVEQRRRQESAQGLAYLDQRMNDPVTWRDATPEQIGEIEGKRRQYLEHLELPYQPVADPRPGAFAQDIRRLQEDVSNGKWVTIDDEGNPYISDLAFAEMESRYGPWLGSVNVDMFNERSVLEKQAEEAQAAESPGGPKPPAGRVAEKTAKPKAGEQAQAGNMLRPWNQTFREILTPYANPPPTLPELLKRMQYDTQALVGMAYNPDVTPEEVELHKNKIIEFARKYHIPGVTRDALDRAIVGAGATEEGGLSEAEKMHYKDSYYRNMWQWDEKTAKQVHDDYVAQGISLGPFIYSRKQATEGQLLTDQTRRIIADMTDAREKAQMADSMWRGYFEKGADPNDPDMKWLNEIRSEYITGASETAQPTTGGLQGMPGARYDENGIEITEKGQPVVKPFDPIATGAVTGVLGAPGGMTPYDVPAPRQPAAEKPDPFGRDTAAIAAAPSAEERATWGGLGFTTTAMMNGPNRIRPFMGDETNFEYESVDTNHDKKPDKKVFTGKLSEKGWNRLQEINATEAAAHPQFGGYTRKPYPGKKAGAPKPKMGRTTVGGKRFTESTEEYIRRQARANPGKSAEWIAATVIAGRHKHTNYDADLTLAILRDELKK